MVWVGASWPARPATLNCDGQSDNGCEVNGSADINNCGTCGNKCPPAEPPTPPAPPEAARYQTAPLPYLTCGAGPTTSCETNISNDVNNCGACAKVCDPSTTARAPARATTARSGLRRRLCRLRWPAQHRLQKSAPRRTGALRQLQRPAPGVRSGTANVGCNINACSFSCRGDNYDLNGDPSDGCELADDSAPGHPGAPAGDRGSKARDDAGSLDAMTGKVISDGRVHENPTIPGLCPRSAPPRLLGSDRHRRRLLHQRLHLHLHHLGRRQHPCYLFSVDSDRYSDFVILTGSQTGSLSAGSFVSPAYGSDTTIQIGVQKICSVMTKEAVNYLIRYHL